MSRTAALPLQPFSLGSLPWAFPLPSPVSPSPSFPLAFADAARDVCAALGSPPLAPHSPPAQFDPSGPWSSRLRFELALRPIFALRKRRHGKRSHGDACRCCCPNAERKANSEKCLCLEDLHPVKHPNSGKSPATASAGPLQKAPAPCSGSVSACPWDR